MKCATCHAPPRLRTLSLSPRPRCRGVEVFSVLHRSLHPSSHSDHSSPLSLSLSLSSQQHRRSPGIDRTPRPTAIACVQPTPARLHISYCFLPRARSAPAFAVCEIRFGVSPYKPHVSRCENTFGRLIASFPPFGFESPSPGLFQPNTGTNASLVSSHQDILALPLALSLTLGLSLLAPPLSQPPPCSAPYFCLLVCVCVPFIHSIIHLSIHLCLPYPPASLFLSGNRTFTPQYSHSSALLVLPSLLSLVCSLSSLSFFPFCSTKPLSRGR